MRSKRILFLIGSIHVKTAGGIGQFLRGVQDWAEDLDAYLDVGVDKALSQDQKSFIKANVISPDTILPYTDHRKFFAFGDSLNYEMVLNFRNTIIKAFRKNLYTHVVVNTPEAMYAIHALGIKTPTILYTHQESMTLDDPDYLKNPTFTPEYCRMVRFLSDIDVGTQTPYIAQCVNSFSPNTQTFVLPFLFAKGETGVVKTDGEGVLFIGRWEERKQPKVYLEVLKATGLKGKVMTNANGAKKFKAAAEDMGVELEIKYDILGEEKTDFISSARVAFHPNTVECCPFAVFETMTRIPTLILTENSWHQSFSSLEVAKATKKSAGDALLALYRGEVKLNEVTYDTMNEKALEAWKGWMNMTPIKSHHSFKNQVFEAIRKGGQYKPVDLIQESVYNQTSINQLLAVHSCHDVNVAFTEQDTLISINPIKVDNEESMEDFFV